MAGVRPVRVLVPRIESHLEGVAAHVRAVQAAATVVFVTADRPYSALLRAFDAAGVDSRRIHFLDLITSRDGKPRPPVFDRNAFFLESPTMLEMMAVRLDQLLPGIERPHVVLDSLNSLALYNGVAPVQEFTHYLANRLRGRGVPADFVVRDNLEGQAIRARIASFVDAEIVAEASL